MKNHFRSIVIGLLCLVFLGLGFLGYKSLNSVKLKNNNTIEVVAAENFWGSLVSQIGGNQVHVLSIVSDPNADPHEYESNNSDARAIARANYVILNGAGYDSWGNKMVDANPSNSRVVLNVANLLNMKEGDNPHFWYSPNYVNQTVQQMELDLAKISPSQANYFQHNLKILELSLSQYQNRIKAISNKYGGTKVAATEDIFQYLAQAANLNLVSPPSFIQAVAEGNDPPAGSIIQFQNQLTSRQVKILVYNEQTVTPLTNNIKNLANKQNIPIVGVTETIQPPTTPFQDWMNTQVINIQNALISSGNN